MDLDFFKKTSPRESEACGCSGSIAYCPRAANQGKIRPDKRRTGVPCPVFKVLGSGIIDLIGSKIPVGDLTTGSRSDRQHGAS